MGRCWRSIVKVCISSLLDGGDIWHGACGRAGDTGDGLAAALGYCQPLGFLLFAQTRRDKSIVMLLLLCEWPAGQSQTSQGTDGGSKGREVQQSNIWGSKTQLKRKFKGHGRWKQARNVKNSEVIKLPTFNECEWWRPPKKRKVLEVEENF